MKRRQFIHRGALGGAGLLILPSGQLRADTAANEKLNIALIGVAGRAEAHHNWLKQQSVVALCDIREDFLGQVLKKFPKAKCYIDWRKCLDHPNLDAVVVCTADHHHALISNWAMSRGLHVYCEKPHAISVEEARLLRSNWLERRGKIATQVGTQMHAQENYRRIKEMILDGAIGELQSVSAWGNRKIRRDGHLIGGGKPPADLHWDLWLGPAPNRQFHPDYFSGRPGANCLQWNMYWDWGAGQVGDMGSHMMDLVYSITDARLPTKIRATGETFNSEVSPVDLECHFDHPANSWRGPIRISWFQGGRLPRTPRDFIDLDRIGHGAMFRGTEGFIIASYTQRLLIPSGKASDLSYYQPRPREKQLPEIGAFHQDWIDSCKDPSRPTCCDFDYHGNIAEQMQLGLVAYRAGQILEYDSERGVVTNFSEANAWLKRSYRAGWQLDG